MPLQNRYCASSEAISSFYRRETLDWRWSILFNLNRHWTFDIARALHSGRIATDAIYLARLGLCYFWTSEAIALPRHQGSYGDNPRRPKPFPRARPSLSESFLPPLGSCPPAYAGATGTQRGLLFVRFKFRRKKSIDPRLIELFKPGNWTREPNPVYEALMHNDTGLGKNDGQIIRAIIRETFGRQEYSNRIFRERIRQWTGLDISVISHRLSALRRRNILIRYEPHSWGERRAVEWGIEPDTTKWLPLDISSERNTQGANHPQIERANHPLSQGKKRPPYKEEGSKDKTKERRIPIEERKPRY